MSDEARQGGEEKVDAAKINVVKDVLRHLDKVVKTMALFGKAHSNVQHARSELGEKLNDFLAKYGQLVLDLDGKRILCDRQLILDNEGQKEEFNFRLFQDGVIQLVLRQGISDDELDGMLEILLADFHTGPFVHDDTVTLFWEAAPTNWEFVLAPDFEDSRGEGEGGAEATPAYREVRISLADRAVAGSKAAARVAPEGAQQLVKTAAAVAAGKLALSAQEIEQIRAEAAAGEPRLIEKYVEGIFRVIADTFDPEHRERAVNVVKQLFVGMIDMREMGRAGRLIKRLRVVATPETDPSGEKTAAVERIAEELSSVELIGRVMQALAPRGPDDQMSDDQIEGTVQFLAMLGVEAVEPILDKLDIVEDQRMRRRLCDLLAHSGKERVDLFRQQLAQGRDEIMRDVLYILGRIGGHEAAEAMLMASRHENADVRLLVLKATGELKTSSMLDVLFQRIDDKDDRVRNLAIQRIEGFGGKDAARKLQMLIRDKEFVYRDKDEKRKLFGILGKVSGKDALPFFRECFETKNPLKRPQIDELRGCGAYMLGVLGDQASREALEKGAKQKLASSFFKWSCGQALAALDGKKPGGPGA